MGEPDNSVPGKDREVVDQGGEGERHMSAWMLRRRRPHHSIKAHGEGRILGKNNIYVMCRPEEPNTEIDAMCRPEEPNTEIYVMCRSEDNTGARCGVIPSHKSNLYHLENHCDVSRSLEWWSFEACILSSRVDTLLGMVSMLKVLLCPTTFPATKTPHTAIPFLHPQTLHGVISLGFLPINFSDECRRRQLPSLQANLLHPLLCLHCLHTSPGRIHFCWELY